MGAGSEGLLKAGGSGVSGSGAAAVPGVTSANGSAALSRPRVAHPAAARTSVTQTRPVAGGSLDPAALPKYVTPLAVLSPMPMAGTVSGGDADNYCVAFRQFRQQILPAGFPPSTVWGYGSPIFPASFHAPSHPIEAVVGRPVRVTWQNQLVDGDGKYLPHLFTVDPTLHWANPPGGTGGRDSHSLFTATPPPYTGPVPGVVHLHGGHSQPDSDGYPSAWYLPMARNIPAGYANAGSFYGAFKREFLAREGVNWPPGSAVYQYANDQRAAALWFHDHTLGMTRINTYAGLSGYYLLRGGAADLPPGVLPGPAPRLGDRPGTRHYEVPMVIQDRSFNSDGSLFFPGTRAFFDDTTADWPGIPFTDTSPYWNPGTFGAVMCVNGQSWPTLTVEPRRYRFRFLNACNARTLIMKIVLDPLAPRPASPVLPFWHIGADGGFLPAPVQSPVILLGLSERADVIVDFTGIAAGTAFYLINEGPDRAFDGSPAGRGVADPGTSGQVMRFEVGPLASHDTSVPPSELELPPLARLGAPVCTRGISLNEIGSAYISGAMVGDRLGTVGPDGKPNPLAWADPITEAPVLGSVEEWVLHNFTADAHPVHVGQVAFEVIGRQPFGGTAMMPEPWEAGTKDTVITYPDTVTRIRARFDIAGRYVTHSQILDHGDNEMIRPFTVVPS